ncbi:MAG TPA: YDG domain-containing protein [Tepidisphaeraceae bacterium]|nr:YDG domain-containing protein [Tepidisphaeraceae bacterium]
MAGTHIINNIITNQVTGIYLSNNSSTDAAVIQFNSITNNNQPGDNGGRAIYTDQSVFGTSLTNVTIDSNYFYGNTGSQGTTGFEAAVAVEPSTTGLASNINVTNNIIDNNGKAVLFFNTNNITFSGNYVTESQDQWSGSVRFEGGDTNVTISNNTIYDNTGPGVAVDSKGTPAPDSGFVLSGNNFYGNSSVWGGSKISVIVNANAYSGAFTATNNWWGSSTGPSGDGSGSGDAIWGNGMAVTAQQWQTASGGSATFSPWSTTPNGTEDAPYRGAPFGAGAPFQAADFNHGGNGIGYSTSATSNAAGQYRPGEDISIENTTDTGPGSFDVTGTAAGQWMDYTINVATTGSYNLSFRVATSQTTGGTFHVMNGAANLTGTMTVPGTGGNQTWQTITSSTVTLNSGTQTLRLMFDTNGSGGSIGNFHWLEFASAAGTPAAPSGLTATAFSSSQINLSWTNNATNQTGFEIDRSLNGTSFSMLTNVAGTVTTYSDMNLNANTSYWYRVEATNAAGKSPSSNVASAVTGLLTPAFSNLSSPTITYGAATTTLSGTISAGTSIPTGNVKITINGAFVNAAINATTGAFSTSFDTHALPVSGSPYTITYSYAANGSFNGVTDTSKTLTITPKALTVTATGVNKVYDGTTTASATLADSPINGDVVTASFTSAAFSDQNVGNGKTVTVSGIALSGAGAGNYTPASTTASTTANITAKNLTVSGVTASNKPYDGTTAATLNFGSAALVGVVTGDTVTLNTASATGTFASKVVANNVTVTVAGLALSGAQATNYTLTQPTTTANITAKALTVSGVTANNKTYDGNTTAALVLTGAALVGVVTGDTVTLSTTGATGAFSSKNVANGITVNVTGMTISGASASNYTLTQPAPTANIAAKALTVTGVTANNKPYDATTTATLNLGSAALVGVVSGDTVTLNTTGATGAFASKDAATGITVTVSGLALAGAQAGNYTVTPPTTTANITPISLTVTATGINKVYDGTTTATITPSDNRLTGDQLTESYTANFSDKNVANGKTVSVTGISISGANAQDYSLANTTASTTANITPRALTITATGVNKVYDATTNATVTLTDNRITGDQFTDSYIVATFSNKNVGTNKAINVGGVTILGADAANYTFGSTASATANITPLTLTVTATGINKVYDATTTAAVTLSDNHLAGDNVTDNNTAASFSDKNVGAGKTVTVSGITLTGTDAANYAPNTTATTTANITPRSLTVTATGINKIYDGATTATVTLADNRITGDNLTDNFAAASFADKNVANGKTVSVSGITITGTDAGNYTATNTTASTTANITPLALTVSATGINKIYDATTAANVTLSDNRITGDQLSDNFTAAAFSNKNVANGKTVSISGITVTGTDSANYTFNTTATTIANITPRTLLVTATGVNKVYDGATTATVTLSDNHLAGDTVTDNDTAATFSDKNVGTGKTVSVSGISLTGADAGNYTANTTALTVANITPRNLTITATGVNKVYDGTTTASVTLSDNRVTGDSLTDNFTAASYADKNVANGKTVSISGITVSGTDAGNYTATNTTASATANITPLALTVSATGVNKVYDATTAASVTLADNRVTGDQLSDNYTTATFSDKNVANGKTVGVSGITVSGTDSGNYTFNTTATTTANITPRSLTVTATGVNKVYDGTTVATVMLSDNHVAGDSVTDNDAAATFADKNVGAGKPVSVSGISLTGADAGNYSLTGTTATTTASITGRPMTISATGINKVYDATNAATVTLTDNRVTGDSFTDSYTAATFPDKNVGNGKTVSVSGITITGADAGNYFINTTATTAANITPLTLSVTATASNKVYDATNAASVTLSDHPLGSDSVSAAFTSATFSDKNVGAAKTVTVSGISLSGADSGNYSAPSSATTTANITPRALSITATGQDKIYDGTANATVALSDNRLTGDQFTINDTALFPGKNVGTAMTVTVSGISLTGADSGNYTPNTSTTTTASITPRALVVSAAGVDKVYDGTTAATVMFSDNRIAGDSLSETDSSAVFSDKNVGAGKTVSVTGISLSGADAGNYIFNTTASTAANITQRVLMITAAALDKPYDGMTAATVNLSDNRLSGDQLSVTFTNAVFSDPNVGSGKTVTVNGLAVGGTDAGNYSFNPALTTTASITPELTVTGTASADTITLIATPDQQHIDWFLNGSAAFGQLAVNDPSGLTINGNGGSDIINLQYTNGNPLPANLHVNGTFTLNGLTGTNPLANTTLDIGRSTILITYGTSDPIAAIQSYLLNGYKNGTWSGTPTASTGVITSLAAQANPNHTTAIAYADSADGQGFNTSPNTIELKYDLYGDDSLDGQVNSLDLQVLLFNLNRPGGWDQGDFNYDGQVNSADLQALLFTLNTSLGNQVASTTATASATASTAPASPALPPTPAPTVTPSPATTVSPSLAPAVTVSAQHATAPAKSVVTPVVRPHKTPRHSKPPRDKKHH